MGRYNIYVTFKPGVHDPAGKAVEDAVAALGYEGLSSLRIGKFIELEAGEALSEAAVQEICDRLLSNPVIEDYRIETIAG